MAVYTPINDRMRAPGPVLLYFTGFRGVSELVCIIVRSGGGGSGPRIGLGLLRLGERRLP